ncbi:MAG: ribokinase [Clostridiales bacterium]|nr:ribokinase [Clostridiales bacterium]
MIKPKIVVVGSSNTDMIIKVPHIPKPGETILGGKFSTASGGKGANQTVAAARSGGDVTLIACLGKDMFGEKALQGFVEDGINVDNIKTDPKEPSGVAEIFVDENGENSIAVASGANLKLSPQDVRKIKGVIANSDILLMQLEIPVDTVRTAAKIARKNGVKVILNPAPAQKLEDDLLQNISIITPNEIEAEMLTGIKVNDNTSVKQAADILLKKGIETVIITLGQRGAFYVTSKASKLISGFQVKAVDATAAGDTFNGALAVALGESMPLKNAISFANAAAALSVTKLGAQPSAPKRDEIEKLLKERL